MSEYRVTDEASVVLLIPGMTLNASMFPALGRPTIAAEYHDLRLGPDGVPDTLLRQRMDLYVRMLHDQLAREPRWQGRRIVVAHSFGGMLALRWQLTAGGDDDARIDGLVLISTTAGPLFERVGLRLGTLLGHELRLPVSPFMQLWNTRAVTRQVKRHLSGGSLKAERVDFAALSHRSDLALELAGWRNTDWRAMRSYRTAMAGFDVRAGLPQITVPVVVLHGSRDSLFPVSAARELAYGLPAAELRLVEGAGHGLPLTHPESVMRAVEDLFD
ncbi:MAG: alpha/beta fold hydrolase [Gemmatimonadales bacterium]